MSIAEADEVSELDSGSFGSIGLPDEEVPRVASREVPREADDFFDKEGNQAYRQTQVCSPFEIPNVKFRNLGLRVAVLGKKETIKEETVPMPHHESEDEFWQSEDQEEEGSKQGASSTTKPESLDFFGQDNEAYEKTLVQSLYYPPNKDHQDLGSKAQINNDLLQENIDMPEPEDDEDPEEANHNRHSGSGYTADKVKLDGKNAELLSAFQKKNREVDSDQDQSENSDTQRKRKSEQKKVTSLPANVVLENKLKEISSKNKNVLNQAMVIPDEVEGDDALQKLMHDRDRKQDKPKKEKEEAPAKSKVCQS